MNGRQLRVYPPAFARAVVQVLPELSEEQNHFDAQAPQSEFKPQGFPVVCLDQLLVESGIMTSAELEVDLTTPLHELFGKATWSTWEDCDLDVCIKYLRGSTALVIPDKFRDVLPAL